MALHTYGLRKQPKYSAPRWAEACTDLLRHLGSLPGPRCLIATQLSDVLHTDPAITPLDVLPADAARQLTLALYTDSVNTLNQLRDPEIMVWAPTDASLLGRWLSAYLRPACCGLPAATGAPPNRLAGRVPRLRFGRAAE